MRGRQRLSNLHPSVMTVVFARTRSGNSSGPVGTTLLAGRYRMIDRLGSGGMATVLLAEDERLGRQVAIKRLHAESPEDTARRFKREAKLGASLNHPNIVGVYDIVTDDEGVLIVMEYVEGETLPTRSTGARRAGARDRDPAAISRPPSTTPTARASSTATSSPPTSCSAPTARTVKLADLGIATAIEGTRITMSGTVLGTAAYMAPEQLEGREPGPAADIYSLAVVAYETLRRPRLRGPTPLEIAERKASEPVPTLRERAPPASPRR